MSIVHFIARRIRSGHGGDPAIRVSPPAIRIAIAGIATGLAVMLLSVAIIVGFKKEVRSKVTSFGAHIQLQAFTANTTYETQPVTITDTLLYTLRTLPDVADVQPFATKTAVLKTADDFLAVAVKGITGDDASGHFFCDNLREGRMPVYAPWIVAGSDFADDVPSNEILISRPIADKLRLAVGDNVGAYFVRMDGGGFAFGAARTAVRTRRLAVVGIYESHFSEYDNNFIAADLRLVQSVNGWSDGEASGLEIEVADFARLGAAYDTVYAAVETYANLHGEPYYLRTVEQLNPQLFGWLELLDTNVWVILILIAAVAACTMTGGLLIIILERTRMIGILKALGCADGTLRRIFLRVAMSLLAKGLLWGNVAGLLLCFVQRMWHPVRLDPTNYYLEWVPIALSPLHVICLNLGTALLVLLVLIIPSALVARISPASAIRAE